MPPLESPPRSLAASLAAVGALLLGACLFLPWVHLESGAAREWRETVERKIRGRPLAPGPEEEYRQLALTLESEGALKGTDLLLWLRTAQEYGHALARKEGVETPLARVLSVSRVGLLAFPAGAFLLLAVLLAGRLRRPSSFMLAFTFLLGLMGAGGAAGLNRVLAQLTLELPELGTQLSLGRGVHLLLGGSALLVMCGLLGSSLRRLGSLLFWVAVLGGLLAWGVSLYVRGGGV